jgi:Na+/H+ antiporter NhaC
MNRKERIIVGLVIGAWLSAHLVYNFDPKVAYAGGMIIGALIGYLGEPAWKYLDKYVDLAIERFSDL